MTAEGRAAGCVSEGGDVAQQPEVEQQGEGEGERAAEQKVEVIEEPAYVTVNSVIAVDTVVEQDGKVEDCHEVKVKQTFTPEAPMPYGPDDSLQDGEQDEECGFCLFMKVGPCGKRFAAWEACVDDAETAGINIVERCAQKTHFLKECMEANPEYYGPVLQAEKAIDERTAMEDWKTGGEND